MRGLSFKTLSVLLLIRLAPARSSSGPNGATFLSLIFPINPLTLDVSNQSTTNEYHLSSADFVNQISNAEVGNIWSSESITSNPPK